MNGFSVSIAETPEGDGVVVTVYGELDMATGPKLREVLEEVLDGGDRVAIDLRGCNFIDSSGIAVLAAMAWRLKEDRRVVEIRGVRERVRHIFELSGLADLDAIRLEPSAQD